MMSYRAVYLLVGALVLAGGCTTDDPDDVPIPGHTPGSPGLGAYSISFYRTGANPPTMSTPALATEPSGSTFIVGVGRGYLNAFEPPTDNKGNGPYEQLGEAHSYTRYSSSGTALYTATSMVGGPDHIVRTATPPDDEITFAAVEVIEGTHVQAFEWIEVLADAPLKSRSVTTTGPATLVAFWWGDAGAEQNKTAVPNNGFAVVGSVLASGNLVQCAVAVKNVDAAGTYDVTWTSTPRQGAQLWLAAVQ